MRDPAVMGSMRSLGVSGDPSDPGQNPQLIFANNYGANKIDYYLRRETRTDIRLQSSGDAVVTTRVDLRTPRRKARRAY